MSSKSALIIVAAVLAVAMAGMMMFSTDSEAAVFNDEPAVSDIEMDSEPMVLGSDMRTESPVTNIDRGQGNGHAVPGHSADSRDKGPCEKHDTEPVKMSERESGQATVGDQIQSEQSEEPQCGPAFAGSMDAEPMPDGFGPRAPGHDDGPRGQAGMGPARDAQSSRTIVIPEKESSESEEESAEKTVEEYEKAYYEKKELEEQGETVTVIDENMYSGLEAAIVNAMQEILNGAVQIEDSTPDFLMQVIIVLETENSSAADVVRDILDKRFFGTEVQTEFQQPNSRSKEDLDDDMESDPVYIDEESEEEDDVPLVFGTVVMIGGDCTAEYADSEFPVRYDNRGVSVAI